MIVTSALLFRMGLQYPRPAYSLLMAPSLFPCQPTGNTSPSMDPAQQLTIINVHTPSASFAIPHSCESRFLPRLAGMANRDIVAEETLQALYSKLDSKLASVQELGSGDEPVGPGWVKYEWDNTVWNLDDGGWSIFHLRSTLHTCTADSDYTILSWRRKSSSSENDEPGVTLFLHNPSLPLPHPPAYTNPCYYLYKQAASPSLKPRSLSPNGARSTQSRKSRKSVRSSGSGMLNEDGVPKFKKDFFKFHNQNGVRTVMGGIGPVSNGAYIIMR